MRSEQPVEFVYVVKRAELFDLHTPHGFLGAAAHRDEVDRYVERIRARGFFVERRFAELDNSMKQVIPYTVVVRGDEILLLRRSKKGGDARLFDKLSIGAGGHVNPPDAEAGDPVAACARRELDEELAIEGESSLAPAGCLNDDTNGVGAVHFGLVHVLRLDPRRGRVDVREKDMLQAGFVPRAELRAMAADPAVNLESWSRLIVLALDEALDAASGA